MNGSNSNTSGATVATVDFTSKGPSDQISDQIFGEIVRRLGITVEGGQTSDIYGGTSEPADKTLIWWPKDPTSGARIGQPQTYDATTNAWVSLGSNDVIPIPQPQRIFGNQAIVAGGSVVTINFTPLRSESTAYTVEIMPSTLQGGNFGTAPTTFANFAWVISSKANNQFTIQFYGVPTGGLSFDWTVTENLAN